MVNIPLIRWKFSNCHCWYDLRKSYEHKKLKLLIKEDYNRQNCIHIKISGENCGSCLKEMLLKYLIWQHILIAFILVL